MHMIKKEQIDLQDRSVQKTERIYPSIIRANSIKYNSARNICAIFSFSLSLHQNQFNEVFTTKGLGCKDFSLVFLLLVRVFQAMTNALCLYYFLFQLLYVFNILLTIRRECRNGRKESDVVRTLL
ncbi:hypothetical protein BAQ48_00560 [Bacillus luti]|nr:hypothetical protein BAQ48_00560 [Bacillus luti]